MEDMNDEISLSEKLCHIEYMAFTIEKYFEDYYPNINHHEKINDAMNELLAIKAKYQIKYIEAKQGGK